MNRPTTRCVLVLGMHRSGTSALAGALGRMGVALGERLLPATTFNRLGYFEREEVFRFHERLLHAIGRTWDDVRPMPDRWWARPSLAAFRSELADLLRRESAGAALWSVKDPRLCRLLPIWRGPLRAVGARPGFVIVARPPREVAASLAARDGFPEWKSDLLYLEHVLELERLTRGLPRCIVTYEQLLTDGASTLRRVGQVLRLPWSGGDIAQAAAFLTPTLRHHRSAGGRAGGSELRREAAACYRALAAGAARGDDAMTARLDRLSSTLDEIAIPWRRLTEELAGHADRARLELDSSRGSLQVLAREVEEARRAHAGRDRVEAELRRALAVRVEEVDRTRESMDARLEEVEAARTHGEALAREIDAARRAHEARDAREGELRTALQARIVEVDAARTHIEALAGEIDAARRAHEARDGVEADLRRALDARERDLATARAEAQAFMHEIEETRRARQRGDTLETELADAMRARLDEANRAQAEHAALEWTLRADLAAQQEALSTARSELAALARELAAARREAAEAGQRSAETRSELEWSLIEAEGNLAEARESLRQLRSPRWHGLLPRVFRGVPDPSPAPVTSDDALRGALDPLAAELEPGRYVVTGWAAARPGLRLLRIALRMGSTLIEAERGLPRPEVERAYPGIEDAAASGFRFVVDLDPGPHRLVVKVEDDREHWHLLAAVEVRVRGGRLRAALDHPRGPYLREGAVQLAGWCCHPRQRVKRLSLVFNGRTAPCTYGLPRADVEAHYPDHPGSGESGFSVTCRLYPGRGRFALRAELASGEVLVHTFSDVVTVVPGMLAAPGRRVARLAASGAGWARLGRHLWSRYRQGGRLPALRQLPLRLRDVARLHQVRERARAAGPAPAVTPRAPADPYARWQRVNQWHEGARAAIARALAASAAPPPAVSVLMTAPPVAHVWDSLREQVHPDWELCVALDAGEPKACATLQALRAQDARVRFSCGERYGGRVQAVNAAAELATGEWLMVLDARSELTPDALAEIALEAARSGTDAVYWDHDVRDEGGTRSNPTFKPGWSPELLLSRSYVGRSWAVRAALFRELGGLREPARGAEDYDFLLRVAERARRIGHVPMILQHEHEHAEREASGPAGQALTDALRRRGSSGRPVVPSWATDGSGPVFTHAFPDAGPPVAIVLYGTDGGAGNGGPGPTRYGDHEVLVAAGLSLDELAGRTRAEYLVFLDARVRARDPEWLSQMVGWALMPGVGAVGARLVGPDGNVQHAGFTVDRDRGRVGPLPTRGTDDGGLADARTATNRWAVGGGCLLTPRELFLELGGFGERMSHPLYGELDYCRRVAAAGHRVVYAAGAVLDAPAGLAAELATAPADEASFRRRHGAKDDALRSPHLAVVDGGLALRPRRLARHLEPPVRALMCSFNLNREGAAYSQYELTTRLKEAGVLDPVVFCPEDGPLRHAYESCGIEVHVRRHPLSGVFEEAGWHRAISTFVELIRETGAALVYGNTVHTFYAIAAAEAAGVASVWNPRESEPPGEHFRHFGPEVAARALDCFRYPYRVVFVAEATHELYRALQSEHNFTVIHNGLDLSRLEREAGRWTREEARLSLGIAGEDVVLLVLGTVCERKGQADLPAALGALPDVLWPRVRALVVGDRGLAYSRSVEAARGGLPAPLRERVAILPETDDPARFYRAADVFVCTSRIESFPRVTLEAMAHGLPLVTTPVFGIREQVRAGVNALFYEPGDTAGLGAALARVVGDPALRARMGAHSRPVLECLNDFEAMARAYAEIFREASLSRGRPLAPRTEAVSS